MYKKTITYTTYDGVEITEDFFFNLNKPELMNMMIDDFDGDPVDELTRILNTKNTKAMIKFVETLIKRSYGVKSADGKRFVKSEELTKEFMETEAYSQFFMDLFQSEDGSNAAAFIRGIIPSDMTQQIDTAMKDGKITTGDGKVIELKR